MSGERQGTREAIGRMTKRLKDGGMPIAKARETARSTALRNERGAVRKKR